MTPEGQILTGGGSPGPAVSQRVRQKERTRAALIAAARQLILDGARITMMGAATAVGVSEATAYRHFPDLPSLLREAFTGLWPDTPEDLAARVTMATSPNGWLRPPISSCAMWSGCRGQSGP